MLRANLADEQPSRFVADPRWNFKKLGVFPQCLGRNEVDTMFCKIPGALLWIELEGHTGSGEDLKRHEKYTETALRGKPSMRPDWAVDRRLRVESGHPRKGKRSFADPSSACVPLAVLTSRGRSAAC